MSLSMYDLSVPVFLRGLGADRKSVV